MEWLEKMNDALAYIETRMAGKIDYRKAAEISCCSLSRFQRMFTFATDITLSEYVRRRRMSLAAKDLLNGDIKIIDLAQKYDYESPEAFTRAFSAFHGMPPTTVKKLGVYTDYPKISFEIKINGGHFNMGTKPLLRIEDHSAERVVSFSVNCIGPEGAALKLTREWAIANLNDYTTRRFMGWAPKGHHPEGESHQPNENVGAHEYIMQILLLGDEGSGDMFLGAEVKDAPRGLFLIGDVAFNEFNDNGTVDIGTSMETAFGVMSECLKDMGGYEFDFNYGDPLKERRHREEHVWSNEWWENPDWQNPDSGGAGLVGFKLWLPIKKVSD